MDWKLSPEQILALQSLRVSPGWRVLSEKLKTLETEAGESALNAETMEDFHRRKGFKEGISQVSDFFQTLFSVSEKDDRSSVVERWLDREISKATSDEELLRFLTH